MIDVRMMVSVTLAVAACNVTCAGPASSPLALSIESQPLDRALGAWSEQTGYQVLIAAADEGDRLVPGVKGTYTAENALKVLLHSSPLQYQFVNARTVAIRATPGAVNALVQTDEGSGGSSAASSRPIEQVVVTAQKSEQRLLDVPVPVSAIRAETLAENNQVLLRDYSATVPSLVVMPSTQSQQTLSIRGVTTGIGNPTVGVTIDDMPYGASTNIGGGRTVPDLDPGDLARVEVLRGPQGTLYGANSMGGLLKFVTRDPSTDAFSGRLQAGTNSVKNGDELGYNMRGSVNVPLGDTFAFRASAFRRRDAGYIDDPVLDEDGVNRAIANGGLLSTMWKPNEDFSLKLEALYQKIVGDGATSVDPTLGDLEQSRARDTGWYIRKAQSYSANMNLRLGSAEVTSITGYNINSFNDSLDYSFALGPTALANFGVPAADIVSDNETKKFSQEVRVHFPTGERLEWLLGAFYMNEDSVLLDNRFARDPLTGVSAGQLSSSRIPTTYDEVAGFANLTVHVTNRFDVQFGGRQSEIRQTFEQSSTNVANVTSVIPELHADTSAFTYLVTPELKINPDVMVYARLASGYRAGGLNTFPGGVVPPKYAPDKTKNYEVGLKGDLLDGSLTLDASAFFIDWDDIQLVFVSPAGFAYTINGTTARSQGLELSVDARPVRGLTVSAWAAWNDATLTEDLPSGGTAVGKDGDRLPISSRISGHLSLEQSFALGRSLSGFVGGAYNYVGKRIGPFRAVAARETFPAYRQIDLRAGVRNDNWTANVFVTNAGDERGVLYGGLGALPPTAYAYIQPRTVGMQLLYSFR